MRNIYLIARRELLAIFSSAIAWVLLTAFQLMNGAFFNLFVYVLSSGTGSQGDIFRWFFGNNMFFWFFVLILIPLITMRLVAEEKRAGTLETLLTAPVSDAEVILGKFAAALVFYLSLWLPSILYVVIMGMYSAVDWGPILSSYLGIVLVGSAITSIGVFTSTLSKNQVIAATLSFMIGMAFFTLGILEYVLNNYTQVAIFKYINFWNHFDELSQGIVDTRPIIYNLSITVIALLLSTRVLAWRHRS